MEANKEEQVISEDVARKEIERWLSHQRVRKSTRNEHAGIIKKLEVAVEDGFLIVEDDNRLTQVLQFPVTNDKGEVTLERLTYKDRLTTGEANKLTKGVSSEDSDTRMICYASGLTGEAKSTLGFLDLRDNTLLQSITVFFIL